MKPASQLKLWVREAKRQGWTERTKGKHTVLIPPPNRPDCTRVTVVCSPTSGHRAMSNYRARLRRAGVRIP